MQIPPSNILSSLIKHYLHLEAGAGHYRLFTDGNPGIVFNFGDPFLLANSLQGTPSLQSPSFLYGQIHHYSDVMAAGKLKIFVIVLRPCSLYRLLGLPAFEWNNQTIPLGDIFGKETDQLMEQMTFAQDLPMLIRLVENFFLQRLERFSKVDPVILDTLEQVYHQQGSIEIARLLKSVPLSERQLERKFKQFVGFTPKKFCEIVQFHGALNQLQPGKSGSVSSTAYDCGYYDPSHFNGYFRKLTGITPLQYRQKQSLLAVNFLEVGPR